MGNGFTARDNLSVMQVARGVLSDRVRWQTLLLALLVFVLLVAPRTRIVIGAPIYLIDVLTLILLASPVKNVVYSRIPKWQLSQVVSVYLALVLVSELRGMVAYGTVLDSIYMMARFTIGISLFHLVPRLVSEPRHIDVILKGVILGMIASAILVILYSLGPTRSLVINHIFNIGFINPGWERLLWFTRIYGADEAAMRGRSLVGAATMTCGFLGTVWPLAFIAYYRGLGSKKWKNLSLCATIIAPVAILMTYGRVAWLMVGTVGLMIIAFGMAGSRRILVASVFAGILAVNFFVVNPDLFFLDRIFTETKMAISAPMTEDSVTERVLSYVEPVEHLLENPIWLIVGSGQAGNRVVRAGGLKAQLYDEVGLATHSAFSKSYYTFGFIAAICQVLFIVLGFRLILKRIWITRRKQEEQKVIYHSLLMAWTAMTLWWLAGHAMVGEPRGVMLFFFMYGLLMAFEKLRISALAAKRNTGVVLSNSKPVRPGMVKR